MATTKNITMKQFNGTDYDTLYPKTVYNQVSGVAPAGYGLGESTPTLISNCNIVGNGWYRVDASTANIPDVGLTSGVLRIDEATGSLVYQSLYFYASGKVHKMERVHSSGTWYPWEWLNPPMNLGVEYRTTERYQGKPVYVKLVDCGALPNNTSKSISISDDTTIRCFDVVTGTNSSGMVLPTASFGGTNLEREVAITSNGSSILIVTNFNGSSYTKTYVLVKYYKTTD